MRSLISLIAGLVLPDFQQPRQRSTKSAGQSNGGYDWLVGDMLSVARANPTWGPAEVLRHLTGMHPDKVMPDMGTVRYHLRKANLGKFAPEKGSSRQQHLERLRLAREWRRLEDQGLKAKDIAQQLGIRSPTRAKHISLLSQQDLDNPLNGVSNRIQNCLKNDDIHSLEDLATRSVDDLARIPNLGKKGILEIKMLLASHGLVLRKHPLDHNGR